MTTQAECPVAVPEYDAEEVFEIEQGPGLPGHPGASPLDSGTAGIHTPGAPNRPSGRRRRVP